MNNSIAHDSQEPLGKFTFLSNSNISLDAQVKLQDASPIVTFNTNNLDIKLRTMNMPTLRIAAIQMEVQVAEPEINLERSRKFIIEAAAKGSDLICFPESVLDGYACRQPDLFDHSRPIRCAESDEIARLALYHRVWILWSMAERDNKSIYNSALLFNHEGELVLHYRKTHLCGEVGELQAYQAGSRLITTELNGWKVGVMICYDRHYPEVARTLSLNGTQLILHPSATVWFKPDPQSLNTAMMRTRAYENRCFILSINQANYGGGSALFGPWGEILKVAGGEETILMTEADPSLLSTKPEDHFDIISGRRSKLYSI